MNIWVIQTGERLPLEASTRMMRTGLLAQELARRSHTVTWWASAFDHYARDWVGDNDEVRQISRNLSLRLLKGIGYRKNLSVKRFADHAIVARRFSSVAIREQRPDAIVAALPDYRIAYAAYRYARRNKVPFILDLRDRWPWDFVDLVPKTAQPLARLALAFDFKMAKALISDADALVTMMQSWDDWIVRIGGRRKRPLDRVFYLGAENPKPDERRIRPETRAAIEACRGRWPILFVGAFTNRSWPRIALEMAERIKAYQFGNRPRPIFILAGDGDFLPEMRKIAAKDPDIVLPGYINDAEIAALLVNAKVGLVTGNSDFEAMPNKVFTYLSGGVPILTSLNGELKDLVEAEDIGMVRPDAVTTLEGILSLMHDEPRRASMSANASRIFRERYEAGKLYSQFANLVERLASDEFWNTLK